VAGLNGPVLISWAIPTPPLCIMLPNVACIGTGPGENAFKCKVAGDCSCGVRSVRERNRLDRKECYLELVRVEGGGGRLEGAERLCGRGWRRCVEKLRKRERGNNTVYYLDLLLQKRVLVFKSLLEGRWGSEWAKGGGGLKGKDLPAAAGA
jgi:hypothetical protein